MSGELVLVAEGNQPVAALGELYLEREGFRVHLESAGDGALAAARSQRPAVLVLEVTLPGLDGIEVYRALRAEAVHTPTVFVTSEAADVTRVVDLGLTSDDYVCKPFSPRDLVARVVARVRGRLRPNAGAVHHHGRCELGDVSLDPSDRVVTAAGHRVALTATEFELLAYFVAHPNRVHSREQLLTAVWGVSAAASARTVDVHVAQVRAKLGQHSPIQTVRGVGYLAAA